MIDKIRLSEAELSLPKSEPALIRTLDSDGNSIISGLDKTIVAGSNALTKIVPVTYNKQVLIGKGVGLLIIQEGWHTIRTSLFYVSTDEIATIYQGYNSAGQLSLQNGEVYWTENDAGSKSIRVWFQGIETFSYT